MQDTAQILAARLTYSAPPPLAACQHRSRCRCRAQVEAAAAERRVVEQQRRLGRAAVQLQESRGRGVAVDRCASRIRGSSDRRASAVAKFSSFGPVYVPSPTLPPNWPTASTTSLSPDAPRKLIWLLAPVSAATSSSEALVRTNKPVLAGLTEPVTSRLSLAPRTTCLCSAPSAAALLRSVQRQASPRRVA